MKKGLILTLATVAVALLCTVSYGYAPLIKDIPQVWIGNDGNADIPETVSPDLYFFRYTNAFNFDQYVYHNPLDEDQSTTNVRWSFLADSADLVTINGIETLSDASEALKPEDVGKELTSYPNNDTPPRATSFATFRDILDSPTTSEPPYPAPTSGSELNTIITIFASNGTKASSKEVVVRANLIDGIDKLSSVVESVWTDAAPSADWSKLYPTDRQFINAFDGSFYIATQLTSGGSIGASGHATNSVWSYWNAPATAATYVANQVYRAKYTIHTTQTNQNNVPNMRMLLSCTDGTSAAFAGGSRIGKGPSAPTSTPQVYDVYFGPRDLSTLLPAIQYVTLSWELIDFATDENGTNYLDSVELQRFPTPDKVAGTSIKTFQGASGFAGWTSYKLTQVGGVTFYGDVTFGGGGTASNVSIQTPGPVDPSGHINWGQWSCGSLATPSGVTFEANKLYRTVYTLSANSQSLGKVRLINNTIGGQWSAELDADSNAFTAQMPTPGGLDYDVWQESMPTLYSGGDVAFNGMTFLFDVSDGRADQSGTTVLSKVEVLSYDIP